MHCASSYIFSCNMAFMWSLGYVLRLTFFLLICTLAQSSGIENVRYYIWEEEQSVAKYNRQTHSFDSYSQTMQPRTNEGEFVIRTVFLKRLKR